MYATDFEFNGIKASEVGLVIGSWDGESTQDIGCNITYNTSKPINSNRWNIHGSHYEEPLSIPISCIKNPCVATQDDLVFTPTFQAFLYRWLVLPNQYAYLRFMQDGYEDIYYYCTMSIQWKTFGGRIIGLSLTATCDSPHGYSKPQFFSKENWQKNETFTLYSDSDEVGAIVFDQIELYAKDNGQICIRNDLDAEYSYDGYSDMIINNCRANELFLIDGITKQISYAYDSKHEDLADDYNNHPLRIVNYDNQTLVNGGANVISQSRKNVYRNKGIPCSINLTYRTIRQAVI